MRDPGTTNRVVWPARSAARPRSPRTCWRTRPARRSRDIGYEQDGFHWQQRQGRRATCTRSRPTSPRASTPPATRTRAPATRASCSAMPAARPTALMPAPIQYSHHDPDAAWPRPAIPARRRGSGPTPRARSPCATRTASRSRATSVVVSTQHARRPRPGRGARDRAPLCRWPCCPNGWMCAGGRVLRQPDRPLRHRRPGRRRRPDRPQDHRRHLRRRGAAWRRRLLRQGPDQGRPLGRLCRRYLAKNVVAAGLAERCTIQISLCDRRRRSRCRSTSTRTAPARSTRTKLSKPCCSELMDLSAARHPRASRPEPADLRPHLGLRPFRPRRRRPMAASPGSGLDLVDELRAAF